MSSAVIIRVQPDGTVRALHTDVIDLLSIGRARIRRITNIEFNAAKQVWEVRPVKSTFPTASPARRKRVLFAHTRRDQCLKWEAENILSLLDKPNVRRRKSCGKNCKKN